MDKESPATAAVMAAFLRTGKQIDQASMLLVLIAAIVSGPWLVLALLAAGVQKYHALRVALDAELFAVLERHPEHSTQWDAALALCAGRPVSSRPLVQRWQGARRLQQRQIAAFAVQILLFAL